MYIAIDKRSVRESQPINNKRLNCISWPMILETFEIIGN